MVINSLNKKEKRSNPNSGIALKIDATRDWDIGGPEISIWNTSASSEIRLVDELTVQREIELWLGTVKLFVESI